MKIRLILAAAALAAFGATAFAFPGPGQGEKMGEKKMTMPGKMDHAPAVKGPVYVCQKCRLYYPEAMARKWGGKDPMGHKLVRMDRPPKGMKRGGPMSEMKMDKMHEKGKAGKTKGDRS